MGKELFYSHQKIYILQAAKRSVNRFRNIIKFYYKIKI